MRLGKFLADPLFWRHAGRFANASVRQHRKSFRQCLMSVRQRLHLENNCQIDNLQFTLWTRLYETMYEPPYLLLNNSSQSLAVTGTGNWRLGLPVWLESWHAGTRGVGESESRGSGKQKRQVQGLGDVGRRDSRTWQTNSTRFSQSLSSYRSLWVSVCTF